MPVKDPELRYRTALASAWKNPLTLSYAPRYSFLCGGFLKEPSNSIKQGHLAAPFSADYLTTTSVLDLSLSLSLLPSFHPHVLLRSTPQLFEEIRYEGCNRDASLIFLLFNFSHIWAVKDNSQSCPLILFHILFVYIIIFPLEPSR